MRNITSHLTLADQGWLTLDEASLRVCGAIDSIVKSMEEVLNDEAVRSLCSSLGILCSGFLFYDTHRELRLFFEEDHRQPQTYRTRYLWSNPEMSRWSDLIHWLFVYVRGVQSALADKEKTRTEDYFRYVPKHDGIGHYFSVHEYALRQKSALHYVTLGETLFSLLAWRTLTVARSMRGPDHPLFELDVALDEPIKEEQSCSWNGEDLLSLELIGERNVRVPELRQVWSLLNPTDAGVLRDWELLGVTGAKSSTGRAALMTFARACGALQPSQEEGAVIDEELHRAIQRHIADFLLRLGAPIRPQTIGEALCELERYARFPLLPFYVWSALDRAAKCYLVSPVWTSQHYNVSVDQIPCRHLGLALSAVSPLHRVDWTLPSQIPADGAAQYSEADPSVIANVLRLMARPLVETHLYTETIRVLQGLRDQLIREADRDTNTVVSEIIKSQ